MVDPDRYSGSDEEACEQTPFMQLKAEIDAAQTDLNEKNRKLLKLAKAFDFVTRRGVSAQYDALAGELLASIVNGGLPAEFDAIYIKYLGPLLADVVGGDKFRSIAAEQTNPDQGQI